MNTNFFTFSILISDVWSVIELNGQTVGADAASTITPMDGSVDCVHDAAGARAIIGDTAKFLTTSTGAPDLQMKTYLFRNAAAFAAARSEIKYTMDLWHVRYIVLHYLQMYDIYLRRLSIIFMIIFLLH